MSDRTLKHDEETKDFIQGLFAEKLKEAIEEADKKARRERIASAALSGLCASDSEIGVSNSAKDHAEFAIDCADAKLKTLAKATIPNRNPDVKKREKIYLRRTHWNVLDSFSWFIGDEKIEIQGHQTFSRVDHAKICLLLHYLLYKEEVKHDWKGAFEK